MAVKQLLNIKSRQASSLEEA